MTDGNLAIINLSQNQIKIVSQDGEFIGKIDLENVSDEDMMHQDENTFNNFTEIIQIPNENLMIFGNDLIYVLKKNDVAYDLISYQKYNEYDYDKYDK